MAALVGDLGLGHLDRLTGILDSVLCGAATDHVTLLIEFKLYGNATIVVKLVSEQNESHLNDVTFRDIDELGSVLQHGEDEPLDVDHPGGIFPFGANRLHGTILPSEGQRSLLQLAGIHLLTMHH